MSAPEGAAASAADAGGAPADATESTVAAPPTSDGSAARSGAPAGEPDVGNGTADDWNEEDEQQSLLQRIGALQSVWILGVLLLIVVFFSIAGGDRFLSTSNFSLISQNVAVWAVIAVGMTFVIVTSGIDLSVGSVLVFSSVIAAKTMDGMGGEGYGVAAVGILAALVSGLAWGLINGFLVAKAKIPPLIVTLGSLSVALGLAQVITNGIDIRSVPEVMTDFNTYIKILGIPALPFTALIVVVIGGVVLHRTRFGRYTYAVGSNELAARRVGVRVDRHLIMVYGLAGLLSGFAAVLALAQFGTTTIAGQSLTNLNVIAAVVIGGTSIFGGEGSIFGTVVGLFIPAVLQAGFVIIGVEPFWQGVAVGTVLVAAVYFDQSRRAAAARGAGSKRSSLRTVLLRNR
ncbi:ABC transporter permease [Cryptosporangium minutisporangium]|uniref:ABC transporter permease n=1 Tax=Cryptosporangium minutisporangium TaxID=113569 RepID=A0ABP6T3B5_9ACTN